MKSAEYNSVKEFDMNQSSKRTPLHDFHLRSEARMSDFGGYEMPLWYPAGPKQEHISVIRSAGLFDTSHMAGILLTGNDCFQLLQRCFSKDLNACIGLSKGPIQEGKCVYGVFLNERGGVIDDSLVYRVSDTVYMIIVNAGMGGIISDHLQRNRAGWDVVIEDYTDRLGKVDIQGPDSAKILSRILKNADEIFEKMPYFNFKGFFNGSAAAVSEVRLEDGTPLLLSRTGYTGEFGFELFVESNKLISLWEQLLGAGKSFEINTCGLAARDSLRAGAVLPLSHQDIGDWLFLNNPWPFALPYDQEQQGFTKDFIGREALENARTEEYTCAFAGYDPRKVVPNEETEVLDETGKPIGTILTCATDMAIDRFDGDIVSMASENVPGDMKFRGLSCGFVKVNRPLKAGDKIYLKGNNRQFEVEIRDDIRPARTARKALKKMI